MKKRNVGFTLVEILVIIGIISILLGLLVPAVSTARKNARKAKCANNMEQMKRFLDSYTSEWNGLMPQIAYGAGNTKINWMEIIYPEWGGWVGYHQIDVVNRTTKDLPEIYQCPSATGSALYVNTTNANIMSAGSSEVYLSQIDNTATTIFISDGSQPNTGDGSVAVADNNAADENTQLTKEGRTRHLDGANYLTVAGGVKFFVPVYTDSGPQNDVSSAGLKWSK